METSPHLPAKPDFHAKRTQSLSSGLPAVPFVDGANVSDPRRTGWGFSSWLDPAGLDRDFSSGCRSGDGFPVTESRGAMAVLVAMRRADALGLAVAAPASVVPHAAVEGRVAGKPRPAAAFAGLPRAARDDLLDDASRWGSTHGFVLAGASGAFRGENFPGPPGRARLCGLCPRSAPRQKNRMGLSFCPEKYFCSSGLRFFSESEPHGGFSRDRCGAVARNRSHCLDGKTPHRLCAGSGGDGGLFLRLALRVHFARRRGFFVGGLAGLVGDAGKRPSLLGAGRFRARRRVFGRWDFLFHGKPGP